MTIFVSTKSTGPKRPGSRVLRIVFVSLLLVLTAGLHNALGLPSNNVPLDHWSYDALDKLAGFGLIQSDLHGTRPYTRLEVARLVNEALNNKEAKKSELPSLIEYFLERFKREFKEELAIYGRGKDDSRAALKVLPIEEAKAKYVYSSGPPRDIINFERGQGVRQFPNGGGGIIATEGTPLVFNNQGVVYGPGSNFTLQFASSFTLWDAFSGYLEPIVVVRQNSSNGRSLAALSNNRIGGELDSFGKTDVDVLTGYVKFSPCNFEVEVGRDSMWWGQGSRGTLILTDNAPPLDLIKLSNPTPTLLPWIFSYLGPFKYTVFYTRLETERDFPHTSLGGLRFDFKPLPNLEIGGSRVFMFGGDNGPSPGSFTEYMKLLSFVEFGGGSSDNTNQIAAFDLRYRMPFLWNAEFYLEWGGEDTGLKPEIDKFLLQDLGYILGIYFPNICPDGRTDFRLEYADNINSTDPKLRGLWYGHLFYNSGYTYQQFILGHSMGPDARDIFARTTHYLRNDLVVGLDFDFMERGVNLSPTIERNYQVGADLKFDINAALTLKTRYVYGLVNNFDLVSGQDRQDSLLEVELKYTF